MTKCPFPETIKEAGIDVPNQRYQDWMAGYAIAVIDITKIVLVNLPKSLGIKLPVLDNLLRQLGIK